MTLTQRRLHGQPRHHAGRSAGARGDAAVLHRASSATPPAAATPSAGRPRRRSRRRARADRPAHRREGEGDRLHERGDRVRQPRDQGRGRVLQGQGQPHHHRRSTEHKAVLDTCKALERKGVATVTYLPVDQYGHGRSGRRPAGDHRQDDPRLDHARQQRDRHDPARSPRSARSRARSGVLFHTDAAQGVGKLPIDVEAMDIDLLSLSAHKIYGPKGVGALYVRRRGRACGSTPIIDGGGHERGMRSGTLNVPGIVGFGKAVRALPRRHGGRGAARARGCASACARGSRAQLDEVYLNGHPVHRLPGQPERQLRLRRGRVAADGAERLGARRSRSRRRRRPSRCRRARPAPRRRSSRPTC